MKTAKNPKGALRLGCLLLAAVFLLTGCGTGTEPTSTSQAAKGRYLEEVIDLPGDSVHVVYADILATGKLGMIGWDEADKSYKYWVLEEGWVEQETPWLARLEEPDVFNIEAIALDGSDLPYCVYTPSSPELEKAAAESEGFYEGDFDEPVVIRYTGEDWEQLPIVPIYNGIVVASLKVRPDGSVLGRYYDDMVLYGPDGRIVGEYETQDWLEAGSFGGWGDFVALTNQNKLEVYRLTDGEPVRAIALESATRTVEYATGRPPQTAFGYDPETDSICYVNKSGIFQTSPDGSLTEKLADASLTSLIMPSIEILQILPMQDGSFVVVVRGEDYSPFLFRYRYDPEATTVPATVLRVYSLYDTPTVRQALGSFQRSRPDVMVKYDVGIAEGDNIGKEDAIRAISTEVLAGDGPDLFVLDELPLESYIEKGVLLDLGELEGDFFERIAGTFRRDGKLYAVPAHFKLPLLLAEPGAAAQVQTPTGLADYLAGQNNPRIGFKPEYVFLEMLRYYYPRWVTEEETLNTDAFSEDLQAFKRIREQLGETPHPDGCSSGGDFLLNGLLWGDSSLQLYIGSLFSLNNLAGPNTALKKRDGELTMYAEKDKVYLPTAILGINAGRQENQEIARAFIDTVLSVEQQTYELGDGLPVNRTAFRAILDSVEPDNHVGTYGYDAVDPETNALTEEFTITSYRWPTKALGDQVMAFAEAAENPVLLDPQLLDIFYEEGDAFLRGEKTLDNALSAAEKRVGLKLAE